MESLEYRFSAKQSFEDFASGRVIVHRSGVPSFPARLAAEVFGRALEYLGRSEGIVLYDPCCGGGYMLTVLGLVNPGVLAKIVGSDIRPDAVELARDNLSLLTAPGLMRRKRQIEEMIEKFGKSSHIESLGSVDKFLRIIEERPFEPELVTFAANILDPSALRHAGFRADIVMTDVPYGNLAEWSGADAGTEPINTLLDSITPVLKPDSVAAISADKAQAIRHDTYARLKKLRVGKRQILFLKPNR